MKSSLEDDSPSCQRSQHLWGAVEASTLPFISILAAGKSGKVRGDLSLAHRHMFLCLPSLAPGGVIPVHRLLLPSTFCGLCAAPDPDWRVRRPFLPFFFRIHATKSPFLRFASRKKRRGYKNNNNDTHKHQKKKLKSFLNDFLPKYTSTKSRARSHLRSFSWKYPSGLNV